MPKPDNISKLNASLTPEERSERARKAAQAGVAAKRERRELAKIVTAYLNTEHAFKDKATGKYQTMTGSEMLFQQVIAVAANPSHRNWARAMDYILALSGQDKAPADLAKLKAEISVLKAKAKLMQNADAGKDNEAVQVIIDV